MNQFRRLVRHFFLQFFAVEFGEGDAGLGPTVAMGMLAVPGAILSFVLFAKYSPLIRWLRRDLTFDPDIASLPDKYTFVALSMTVTGIVTVLRWDSLFPDRRDFANLSPLPIDSRRILLAKMAALTGFVAIFIAVVNLFSTIFFPLIALEGDTRIHLALRFVLAHAIATSAAGLWTFSALIALTGTLMAVLPYGAFRRSRRYVQFVCIIALLLLFMSASGMSPTLEAIRLGQPGWAAWLPPTWFVGLYQVMQAKSAGSFSELASRAASALLIAIPLAAAAYVLSYRRFYLRSAETIEGSAAAFAIPEWCFRILDRALPRSGFDRACLRFILRTLARSDRHTAALASMLALGFALAVQSAADSRQTQPLPFGVLAASLMLIYSLLTGLRLTFGIPSELAANWLFRIASTEAADPQRVIRLVMFFFLIPAVALPAILYGFLYSPAIGVCHLVFATTASAIVIELLTAGFPVVPFTCSWMPGQNNFVFALAVWGAGLGVFGVALAGVEAFLMIDPWRFAGYLGFWAALLWWLRSFRATREPLVWSDTRGALDLLRLTE